MLKDKEYVAEVISLPLAISVNEPLKPTAAPDKTLLLKSPVLLPPRDGANTAKERVTFAAILYVACNLSSILSALYPPIPKTLTTVTVPALLK